MSVLEAAIGWLAPPSCIGCGSEGLALCNTCSTSDIVSHGERCAYCGRLSNHSRTCEHCRHLGGPHSVWISTNYESRAQELVQAYKFGHQRAAALPLSSMMAKTLLEFNDPARLNTANYLVVPLPTATSRARRRGFDHATLLAKMIAKQNGFEYAEAVGRIGQSRQVGATRQARLSQQSGNYFIRHPQRIAGRNILLIDDVVTTGGSLAAVSKVLRLGGTRHVDALVFAKRL